ncbi:energy transducer TonB [Methylobacter sp. YRD-M1]|uniref:energy transducer TonB n=1 Tax=Methylobacter sp. YRD-M1 TaxID=2911520 RepID=UPI00227CE963|nr:energy transducer TonB [Methylobacter sp. YRD-M1]WAK01442.1 TonB family protein [Methylobacter sp. YRD-M1]
MAILVLLLHSLVIVWLLQPDEPDNSKKPPKVMEVALLSAPSPKPAVAPPAPPKPILPKPKPVEPQKVHPKKPPPKQPVKKKPPVINRPAELPKPQPAVEEPLPTPPSFSDSAQKAETPAPAVPQPAINPSSKPAEKAEAAKADSKTVVSGIMPLVRVPPKYPTRAANRHIEGWVKIEFTIMTDGTVSDAVVVEAEPADVFDDAAMDAIKKWQFKEKLVNGVAVTQRAVQILKFKLSK